MKCPKCGSYLSGDSRFCQNCGEKITQPQKQAKPAKESTPGESGKHPFKKGRILCILALIAVVLGAMNIPEFIRRIPGSEFIGIWVVWAILISTLSLVCQAVLVSSRGTKARSKLLGSVYSDMDLMILKKADRYRIIGYGLLKAKLHNVVVFTHVEAGENTAAKTLVSVNPQ